MPRRARPAPEPASTGASPVTAAPASRQGTQAWLLAVGSAALWQIDPALVELGELACSVACASTQGVARESVAQLRDRASLLRQRLAPMGARAVDRVVRRAERASGSVLDKRARLNELQSSWDDLLTCLRLTRR
ncbi:MAG: hypothetical protein U1E71_11610 [Ramlibacter sp.]